MDETKCVSVKFRRVVTRFRFILVNWFAVPINRVRLVIGIEIIVC